MPYVLGKMVATLHSDGRREVTTSDLQVMPGDKPRTLAESGSDPEVWAALRAGAPGTYETLAHFGGATALLVSRRAVALPDPNFLAPMAQEFGELGEDAFLGAVRTGSAAATKNCVDTCGGMFTTLDWEAETLAAMLKILPFRDDGWVRMVLPPRLADHQGAFDDAQHKRWAVSGSGRLGDRHAARLFFKSVGSDTFNGESTLVVFGPLGD